MKLSRIISTVLAICLLLSVSVFASGEASGGASGGSRYLTVSDGTVTVSEEGGWTVDGNVPTQADDIAGIKFVAGSVGDSFLSVTASEHVDPAADGFTAVLGSDEELFDGPNLAQVYDNEGLDPNAEGFPLDYTWISQLDWDETSPTYGQYTAVTDGGQALLSGLLGGARYSNWIEGGSGADETGLRGPTQVSVSGGAALLVQNSYIYSEGLEGLAISNNGSAGVGSTMVVQDSLLVTRGYVPAYAEQSENLPNDPLLVTGADRTNLSGGESVTYYYDSAVLVDGWASLSTDAASGSGVDLVAVNTFASALLGGYGTYADGNCRDYFYGTVLEGAEIGVIIAGTGEVSVYDGDEGLPGGAGYDVGGSRDIDPYAFAAEDADYSQLGGSVMAGGRYAVMMHLAGSYSAEPQGYFYAKDSALVTDRALLSDEDTEYSINASWYGRELSPNIQKYLEYTEGDIFLLRGTNAEVVLDNVTMESYNGVLFHSVLNNDTSTPETPAGTDPVGNRITMSNMDVAGDIVDDDYERPMTVTLDNTVLTGAITSGTWADWTNYWLDAGYVEDYTIGLASNTFGVEAPLDAFVHGITINDDGSYELTEYGDDQGTELTLTNGSVWHVTEASSLTALTIDGSSTLDGTLLVDGQPTEAVPGTYAGQIAVLPTENGDAIGILAIDGEIYVNLSDLESALG